MNTLPIRPLPRLARLTSVAVLAACGAELDGSNGEASDAPAENAPRVSVEHLVLAEFEGAWDPDLEELVITSRSDEEWETPEQIRATRQAAWCAYRIGPTLSIDSVPDSIGFDPAACGAEAGEDFSGFPYPSLGTFCARIVLENPDGDAMTDVHAELYSVSPLSGYDGYRYPYGTGALMDDVPDGENRPTDASGGLWSFGDIGPAGSGTETAESVWVLQNAGGAFRFRGRIVGTFSELADGTDNDCDGRVDEGLGLYGEGEACVDGSDCLSGACEAGFCLRGCSPGFWGVDCTDECPGGAINACNGNGICNDDAGGDGTCDCASPWGGADCGDCDDAHFGANCAFVCPGGPDNPCNGNGVCDSGISGLGECACDAGAHGPNCLYSCNDGVRNGDEFGTDCGDVCGTTCWSRETKFTAFDVDIRKNFSWSIDADGARLVAGATGESVDGRIDAGAIYIFEETAGEYRQVERFEPTVPEETARFGFDVAMTGDVAVGAAPFEDDQGDDAWRDAGAVYVYTFDASTGWQLASRLTAPSTFGNDFEFGTSVDTDGTYVYVGEPGFRCCREDTPGSVDGNANGAVHVYEPDGFGGYQLLQTLTEVHNFTGQARFGSDVSVEDGRMVVSRRGANYSDVDQRRTGSVSIYEQQGDGTFAFVERLDPGASVLAGGDLYGTTVAQDGPAIAVSARRRDTVNGDNTGAVFAWRNDSGSWTWQELVEPAGRSVRNWGQRVDVDGDLLFVSGGGRVYVFEYDGSSYQFIREYTRPASTLASGFGGRVTTNDAGVVVVGAQFNSATPDRGTVFLYDLVASNELSLRQFLVPADVEVGDAFGWEVAIDEDHVVAGAFGEDYRESATTIRVNVGAVYVFTREGTTFSDQAKLEPPEPDGGQNFGSAVDVDGDLIAVGSERWDYNNGQPDVENDVGAVFLYRFDGTDWLLAAQLESPYALQNENYSNFGKSVAVSGEWLFVSTDWDETLPPEDPGDPDACVNVDVVDVFRFDPAGTPEAGETEAWDHFATINAPQLNCGARFGHDIDVDGTRVAIGAHGWDPNYRGSVFVYDFDGNTWVNSARLFRQTEVQNWENLGFSVSVEGDRIWAGAPRFDKRSSGHTGTLQHLDSGRVAEFYFAGGVWNEGVWEGAPAPENNARFGQAVDHEDGVLVVGAIGVTGVSNEGGALVSQDDQGAVYVYVDTGVEAGAPTGTYALERQIVASDVDAFDQFGRTVSIVDRRIGVGAVFEDILDAIDAGAAYVYE